MEIAPLLAGLCVKWCSDNQNVVHILHSGSTKGDLRMKPLYFLHLCRTFHPFRTCMGAKGGQWICGLRE